MSVDQFFTHLQNVGGDQRMQTIVAYLRTIDPRRLDFYWHNRDEDLVRLNIEVLRSLALPNLPLPIADLLDHKKIEGEHPHHEVNVSPTHFYIRLKEIFEREMMRPSAFPSNCITTQEEIWRLQETAAENETLQRTARERACTWIDQKRAEGAPIADTHLTLRQVLNEDKSIHTHSSGHPLKELDLSSFSLEVVPQFLWKVRYLDSLSLCNNGLTWLPDLSFMPYLRTLTLSDNRLSCCPKPKQLPQHLQKLHLDRNHIVIYDNHLDISFHHCSVTVSENPILFGSHSDLVPFTDKNLYLLPRTLDFFRNGSIEGVLTPAPPLAALYFSLLNRESRDLYARVSSHTQTLFHAIPQDVKAIIYQQIWILSGSPEGDHGFGESHLFESGQSFFAAFHNAILALGEERIAHKSTPGFHNAALKTVLESLVNRLDSSLQDEVFMQIWFNDGFPVGDPDYGRHHVMDQPDKLRAALDKALSIRITSSHEQNVDISRAIYALLQHKEMPTKQNLGLLAAALDTTYHT